MGPEVDNRDGKLFENVKEAGGLNETIIALTDNSGEDILLVSQYEKLKYETSGVTYDVEMGQSDGNAYRVRCTK